MEIALFQKIRRDLKHIIQGTPYEGHVYMVGGCVRDWILGNNINDIDFVVDLPNGGIEFAKWLEKENLTKGSVVSYPTYGTAMVRMLRYPDIELEFVQTRREQYKDKNSRNPETTHGTIKEDAMRRDLTINALYYDISESSIVDPTEIGIDDIYNHFIRTTSDPDIIFSDDPLRMLRVCRFISILNWPIDPNTYNGICRNVERIKIISQERITEEMQKSFSCTSNWYRILKLWYDTGLLKEMLPELDINSDWFIKNDRYLNEVALSRSYDLAYTILFKDNLSVLERLKLSNSFIKTVTSYVNGLQYINENVTSSLVRKIEHKYNDRDKSNLYRLFRAYSPIWYVELLNKERELIFDGTTFTNQTKLPINGSDVMEYCHIEAGPVIKQMLDTAWEIYYENPQYDKELILKQLNTLLCEGKLSTCQGQCH